jgi:hypothetical protein
MKDLLQRLHRSIGSQAVRLHEKTGHLALPSLIYIAFGHLGARTFKVIGFKVANEQTIRTQK